MRKMYCLCSVWSLFTYIYQQLSSVRLQRFVVSFSVCIFPLQTLVVSLQKLVVSAFFITKVCSALFQTTKVCTFFNHKSLQGALFQTTKVCSVRIFLLQKFVVSAFFNYKVCSVRFFRLQKLVVSAFFQYKSLQCPHFSITKVCSVRFFRLQKFVLLSCNVLDSVEVHGEIVQCFRAVNFSQTPIHQYTP